jgi:hypothetical protein
MLWSRCSSHVNTCVLFNFGKYYVLQGQDSVVGIESRLCTERDRDRIPARERNSFPLQNVQTVRGAHSAPYAMSTGVFARG